MSVFIFLLIVFILWPVLKLGWRIWMQMRQVRRFMADPEGEMRRQAAKQARRQGAGRYSQAPQPQPKKKKITRDVGEYVEYTEVEVSEEERNSAETDTASFKKEEQISDIKWVDIK